MSARTAIQASDHAVLGRAYESHCDRCFTCKRGDTFCETGAAINAAIATTRAGSDLPGFQEGA